MESDKQVNTRREAKGITFSDSKYPSNNLKAKTMTETGEEEDKEMMVNNLKRCIYRVPGWLKDQVCDGNDRTPYEPEIISFGPYHRGKQEVKEMEKHKWRCLRKMLKREDQGVDDYLREMKEIEKEVRACYQGWYKDIESEAFVEMLVLDGCFMLEFLRVNRLGSPQLEYDNKDPVFSKQAIKQVIARDMIKLENQLPLIVLEKLLSLQYGEPIKEKKDIPDLVMHVLTPILITNQNLGEDQLKPMRDAVVDDSRNLMLHCLDIFRSSLLYKPPDDDQVPAEVATTTSHCLEEQPDPEMGLTPSSDISTSSFAAASASTSSVPNKRIMNCLHGPKKLSNDEIRANSVLMVYCVEDLIKAGVKFKKRKSQAFWDLKFDTHRGVLEIPTIKIDDASKTVFLNLIAYEQCHLRMFWEMSITDYVAFMDNLVNSASDVRHLHQAGIIVHQLGNDEEVADLFNRLVKKAFVSWKDGRLEKLYINLKRYCSHKRHRWSASWRNDYLKNPWVIISVIAAILLFGATLLQTVFTVFPYYNPAS